MCRPPGRDALIVGPGGIMADDSKFEAAARGEAWAQKEIHGLIQRYARHACGGGGGRLTADLAWEDVAQEASARFFEVGLAQYGGKGSEESYLYTIVKSTLLQRARSADRRQKREELSIPLSTVVLPDSFDRLDVAVILRRLDESCRHLLKQAFLVDVSYADLALELELAESSVRAKLCRCLRRARELAA